MKKKKILGMPLAVFIIGLMVLGGASAALVSYLSNTATAEVNVESPVALSFSSAATPGVWEESLDLGSTTALSTVEFNVKVINNADVDIDDEVIAFTLSNDLGDVACDDLSSATFIDTGSNNPNPQELVGMGLCVDNGADVTYNIPINLWEAETTYEYPVTMTFGNVAPTGYDISATAMID